jgi:hypothetical protein
LSVLWAPKRRAVATGIRRQRLVASEREGRDATHACGVQLRADTDKGPDVGIGVGKGRSLSRLKINAARLTLSQVFSTAWQPEDSILSMSLRLLTDPSRTLHVIRTIVCRYLAMRGSWPRAVARHAIAAVLVGAAGQVDAGAERPMRSLACSWRI